MKKYILLYNKFKCNILPTLLAAFPYKNKENHLGSEDVTLKMVGDGTNLSCVSSKEASYERLDEMQVYTGIVDLSCVCSRPHKDIMKQLVTALVVEKVRICRNKVWQLICQKESTQFEIEIMRLENFDYFSYLRIQKVLGKKEEYRKIIGKLLNSLILLS